MPAGWPGGVGRWVEENRTLQEQADTRAARALQSPDGLPAGWKLENWVEHCRTLAGRYARRVAYWEQHQARARARAGHEAAWERGRVALGLGQGLDRAGGRAEDPATPAGPLATIYRWFDQDGDLLYVGKTGGRRGRPVAHRDKEWWPLAVRGTLEHVPAADVLRREREAIQTERPRYNVLHRT